MQAANTYVQSIANAMKDVDGFDIIRMYPDVATFNAEGGAAVFGKGLLHIAGEPYRCDGVNIIPVGRPNNTPEIALARYRAIPNSVARVIAWVGDSTTQNMFTTGVGGFPAILGNAGTDYGYKTYGYPGGPLANITHLNFGESGQTLANFAAGLAANTVASIAAQNPNLIAFRYGINDVRLNSKTKAQLVALLRSVVEQFQAALPGVDILLTMPNSLLYDAANTNSYITPIGFSQAAVQDYSDRLRLAYREMVGQYPGVYVLDIQGGKSQIYPEKVQTTAGNYMQSATDALHPSGEGFAAILRETCLLLGDYGSNRQPLYNVKGKPLVPPVSPEVSYHATTANANDYLVFPRVVEDDTKYNLLLEGYWSAGAAGSFLDIAETLPGVNANRVRGALTLNDICIQYGTFDTTAGSQGESIENGVTAWKITSGSFSAQGNHVRVTPTPAGYPHVQNTGQLVRVYRPRPATQKYPIDPDFCVTLTQLTFAAGTLTFTAQRTGVVGAISASSTTAPTTGGAITIAINGGATIETLTFANNATTATTSGTFTGVLVNEGDIITATIAAGFVSGTNLKIKVANR